MLQKSWHKMLADRAAEHGDKGHSMKQDILILALVAAPLMFFWLAVIAGTIASCILSARITRREENLIPITARKKERRNDGDG